MASEQDLKTLILKIRDFDQLAMNELFNLTVKRLFGLAMKITSDASLSEEIVDDVYLQVWRQARDYDEERSTPIAWMLMLCRSRALDTLRRNANRKRNECEQNEEFDIVDAVNDTPVEKLIGSEVSEEMQMALELLNSKQRQAIALAFYRGMSHREISEYTKEPLGTVKSTLRRAQEILRFALLQNDGDEGKMYGEA